MVRHVVMFTFKTETGEEARVRFASMLRSLSHEINLIRSLQVGENFTRSPRAADLVLIVDVDNADALAEYADHPLHQPVRQMAAEICSETRVVDYVVATAAGPE